MTKAQLNCLLDMGGAVQIVLASAATVVAWAPLCAQEAPASAAGTAATTSSGVSDSEILVTARRRAERLQDVPLAITVLSGKKLAEADIQRADELPKLAVGFSVTAPTFGNATFAPSIRSQRQPLSNLTFDQSVNTYFADVFQARPIGLNSAFYDISSVQVLKGPQGTLFGRNSTGGAILITPHAPDDQFGGYARLQLGNYNMVTAEGALNIPVNDAVQLRFSGRIGHHDGYVHSTSTGRDLDNERTEGGRVSLRIAPPGSSFTTTAVLDYFHENDAGAAYKLIDATPGKTATIVYPSLLTDLADLANSPYHDTAATSAPNGTRIKSFGASVISTLGITDNISVKNIFGYRRINSHLQFDLDGASAFVIDGTDHLKYHQISEELQVLGSGFDKHLDYIIGSYFFRESGIDPQVTSAFGVPTYNNLTAANRSASVFAQGTLRIPGIERLSVTLGGRETWDRRHIGISDFRLGVCQLTTADVNGLPLDPCYRSPTANFSKFTYTASIEYKPVNDVLLYVSRKLGYRTGGFPAAPKTPTDFVPYRPEVVTEHELGVKATWHVAGTTGRTNIALYNDNFDDIQRSFSFQVIDNSVTPARTYSLSTIINAAKARIRGVEFEQMWQPVPSLEFNVAYAYSDAKYTKFIVPGRGDYTNSPFSGAPKHELNGSVRWQLPIHTDAGGFVAQFSGSYRSKVVNLDITSFDPATQKVVPQTVVPGYGTMDARFEWNDIFGKKLSAALWVRNLTQKKYITAVDLDYTPLGIQAALLGQPRTVGADLTLDF